MNTVKKAIFGAAIGAAVSVGANLLGRRINQPMLPEIGQRGGSIASSYVGGAAGNAGFQLLDAVLDRAVQYQGAGVSGTRRGRV